MKLIVIKLIAVTFLVILIFSCSTKKNRFLNRAVHNTTTKFNVLYNGKVAYDAQKKQLDDSYEDDFWNILPIEPLKIEDKFDFPTDSESDSTSTAGASSGFAKAEEKAVKAIQKHSMDINGMERNKQIDDAYFLLGKSRYYDQRFVPALETFKYIVAKYPNSPFFNPARIWAAKSSIRLGNEDEAIYKLDLLLKLKELPDEIRNDALTAMAIGYTKQDSTQQVINLLDSTLLYKTKNYNQRARNLFILGQLYSKQNKIDSSNIIFDKLINFKKVPYRFKIYSQIERAKNYNLATDSTENIVSSLKKLAKNRDNRPFLDAIFYQLGKIELANNRTDEAISYFEKSLRTKQAHKNQQSLAYEDIGNILFDRAEFLNAGSYYDSVLNITTNKNSKRIRRLIRKRKGLDDVIRLENVVHINDSILNLTSLSKEEQKAFFETYIEKLKKQEEEEKIIAQNIKSASFGNSFGNDNSKQSTGGKFYFYNTQTVGFGQATFQKIWGDRALADNWRLSNKKAVDTTNEDEEKNNETTADIDDSKKFDIDYYLDKIPTEKTTLDSIAKTRNEAYYNLGLIYKEQFKKYELSTTKLEKLLTFPPAEKMILPIYYHLYKAFENFNMDKSNYYKNKITAEYADSRYAQIINNPEEITEDTDKNSPENVYKETYKLYKEGEYAIVSEKCTKSITQFANTKIVPKFELLKAYVSAKTTNKEDFIEALAFVATNYPNTEEGIHASKVITNLKEKITEEEQNLNEKEEKSSTKTDENKPIQEKSEENLPSKEEMLKLINKNKPNTEPSGSNHNN